MNINRYFLFSCLFSAIGMSSTVFCQKSKKLKAYIDIKQYYSPVDKNFVEFQLQFIGHTAKFVETEKGSKASIALSYKILEKDSVVVSDSYILESPNSIDSIQDNFYEIKRFKIDPGAYVLQLSIDDINNAKSKISTSIKFELDDYDNKIASSDIMVAELAYPTEETSVFNKSGLHILPFISTYFPEDLNALPYYVEFYNAHLLKDSVIAFVQKIVQADTGLEIEKYTFAQRLDTREVIPIFKNMDISELASGRYVLELSLLNKEMKILTQSSYTFERSNREFDNLSLENIPLDPSFQESIPEDSVEFYLASLIPIANPAESKNIIQTLKLKNEEKSRKHLQSFWHFTSQKKQEKPYEEWIKYKHQVSMVEKLFRTNFQNGHETDRGRVYLKYGAPSNVVSKEVSPSEYPYEIWTYNKIGVFSNKRFLFYNPDLVNNAYRLLHSDMLGERKTPGWAQVLSKRNTNQGDVDNPNKFLSPTMGNNAQDLFRQY